MENNQREENIVDRTYYNEKRSVSNNDNPKKIERKAGRDRPRTRFMKYFIEC